MRQFTGDPSEPGSRRPVPASERPHGTEHAEGRRPVNAGPYLDAALILSGLRTVRGYVRPRTTHIALLRQLSTARLSEFAKGTKQLILAGRLLAETRASHLDAALRIAEGIEIAPGTEADFEASGDATFFLETALATTYIAAALPASAMPHVQHLADLAHDTRQPEWLYRAKAFEAAVYAHSGDMSAADASLREMREIGAAHAIPELLAGLVEFVAHTARTMIAFSRMDGESFAELVAEIEPAAGIDPAYKPLLYLCQGFHAWTQGRLHEALAHLSRVTSGPERALAQQTIREFALCSQAQIHVARGEYDLALHEADYIAPSPGHMACRNLVKATAFIGAQNYVEVLTVTSECMRMRAEHNLWSLGPVLLRRAIASLRLADEHQALLDGADAIQLTPGQDVGMLFLSLPHAEIEELFAFLLVRDPSLEPEIERLRRTLHATTISSGGRKAPPRLTERETLIARQLARPIPLTRIAQELRVSPSTVKSQAHTIYRKLGVNAREEAVRALGESGFYTQAD